jgi:hypothetical protein
LLFIHFFTFLYWRQVFILAAFIFVFHSFLHFNTGGKFSYYIAENFHTSGKFSYLRQVFILAASFHTCGKFSYLRQVFILTAICCRATTWVRRRLVARQVGNFLKNGKLSHGKLSHGKLSRGELPLYHFK